MTGFLRMILFVVLVISSIVAITRDGGTLTGLYLVALLIATALWEMSGTLREMKNIQTKLAVKELAPDLLMAALSEFVHESRSDQEGESDESSDPLQAPL